MKILTGAAIALLAVSTAAAQPGPMGGHGGGPMMGGGMPMMSMGGHCAMMRRTEGALAFLKTELKITAAQEKAWEGFAGAFQQEAANKHKGAAGHGHGPKGPGAKPDAPEPFPQAVTRHLQMMDHHQASLKKLSDAAKPLYDGLNAEQRKTADELLIHFVMPHCMMM